MMRVAGVASETVAEVLTTDEIPALSLPMEKHRKRKSFKVLYKISKNNSISKYL